MSRRRRIAAALFAVLALALEALLISLQHGLAVEYGAGALFTWAVFPLGAALAAAALTGFRWWATAAGLALCGVTVAVLPWVAHLGASQRDAEREAADAEFTCNGEYAEAVVPDAVDGAFHDVAHPAPYWLYGPISGSADGCTAAISGDVEDTFPAWRAALLESEWTVERDGSEVVVVRDDVRLTLFEQDGLSMLHAGMRGADPCADGRSTSHDDGSVSAC